MLRFRTGIIDDREKNRVTRARGIPKDSLVRRNDHSASELFREILVQVSVVTCLEYGVISTALSSISCFSLSVACLALNRIKCRMTLFNSSIESSPEAEKKGMVKM